MNLFEPRQLVPMDALLQEQKAYPFPFLPAYSEFLKQSAQGTWMLCLSDNAEIAMPVRRYTSGFLHILQILHAPLKAGKKLGKQEELMFMEEFIRTAAAQKWADRISQPPTHVVFQAVPEHTVWAPFGTWFLPLQERSESELWEGLHGKNRNVIRNAQNKGIVVRQGMDQLDIFHKLYRQTMERSNLYTEPISSFRQLGEALGAAHLLCAVAYYKETPLGGVLMPYSPYGAYYVYGASASEQEINGAVNMLHWNLILDMKQKGVQRYDFVGTRLSNTEGTRLAGIQQFKSRFGSELEAGVLWKADLKKLKCRFYDFLVYNFWRVKGVELKGDIIDQEVSKSKE